MIETIYLNFTSRLNNVDSNRKSSWNEYNNKWNENVDVQNTHFLIYKL